MQFQCWFCDEGIERSDTSAVIVSVSGLWNWEAQRKRNDDPVQSIYAHSACAKERLKGTTMDLDPSVFVEEE